MATEKSNILPLVLGTAQLGMDYGIANKTGKPHFLEAIDIVKTAIDNGIIFFDTAQAYGKSEEILGRCFKEIKPGNGIDLKVITKLRPEINLMDQEELFGSVNISIKKLKITQLWGLLLHRESILDHLNDSIINNISELKARGLIKHFGVSVYSMEKAKESINMSEIDIIQLPYNLLDQRARREGIFDLAESKKKKIFIRSVFLQGLLLIEPEQLPRGMEHAKGSLFKLREISKMIGVSLKNLAVSFVVQTSKNAMIILGAETSSQLKENISIFSMARDISLPNLDSMTSEDQTLINPSLWTIQN